MSPVLAAVPAVLLGGAADRQADLAGADDAIRAPLALSSRIAFVQLAGGVGASATAAAVSAVIAARRRGPVLAVNAGAGARGLPWYLRLGETLGTAASESRLRPRTRAEALDGLPLTAAGVAVLDVHDGDDTTAVSEAAWARSVAPIARFTPVICTDWGRRGPGADLGGIAAASDVVCVVTRADRIPLERALAAAAAIAALVRPPRVLVAAVDVGGTAGRAPRGFDARAGCDVVRLPFERARRDGAPVDGRVCSAATRTALIRLAAAAMSRSTR